MRFIRPIIKSILGLFSLLLLGIIAIHLHDYYQTAYLRSDDLFDSPEEYILTQVHILPMDRDTLLKGHSLHIKDGHILAVLDTTPQTDLPVIDGEGSYLMPGLMDMHVHVWDRQELGLYLANGITTIRNLWGMPLHLRIKEDLADRELMGPSFYTAGPKLTGKEFIGDDNLNLYSVEEAKARVIKDIEAGYDIVKTYYGLEANQMEAILQIAEDRGIEIAAHPSQKVAYTDHFHPNIISLEHAEEIVQQALNYRLDTNAFKKLLADFKNSPHARLCPTLIVFENIHKLIRQPNILDSADLNYINPLIKLVDSQEQFSRWQGQQSEDANTAARIFAQHQFHLYAVGELHKAGVPIICGTDAGIGVTLPGYSIHQELAFYEEAGLSLFEVLRTATWAPAQSHRFLNDQGSIEAGKRANLIVLNGNPLEDLKHLQKPKYVIKDGQILNQEDLRHFEDQAKGRNNLLATALQYAEYLLFK
jgi:imidazolonepropionase-like amidohydrolase